MPARARPVVLILFDIDGTLVDHARAFRAATGALHAASGAAMPAAEFAAKWSAVHQRHFDRFLCGELTYQEQARARVRDTVDAGLSDEHADDLFGVYIDRYEREWCLFLDVHDCLARLAGQSARRGVGLALDDPEEEQRDRDRRRRDVARVHVGVERLEQAPGVEVRGDLPALAQARLDPADVLVDRRQDHLQRAAGPQHAQGAERGAQRDPDPAVHGCSSCCESTSSSSRRLRLWLTA